MNNRPIIHAIDSLIADQERRHAWLLNDGEKLRRERMEETSRDGERANNASPSDK